MLGPRKYFECACYDSNHLMIVEKDDEPDESWEHIFYIQMTNRKSFWRRAWSAFKYVFKFDGLLFEEMILSPKDTTRLIEFLEKDRYVKAESSPSN